VPETASIALQILIRALQPPAALTWAGASLQAAAGRTRPSRNVAVAAVPGGRHQTARASKCCFPLHGALSRRWLCRCGHIPPPTCELCERIRWAQARSQRPSCASCSRGCNPGQAMPSLVRADHARRVSGLSPRPAGELSSGGGTGRPARCSPACTRSSKVVGFSTIASTMPSILAIPSGLIASEKAGALSPRAARKSAAPLPEVAADLQQRAAALGCSLLWVDPLEVLR